MLGQALRLCRVFHDMTLSSLAGHLGVTSSYISAIENGKKTPNLELLEKYAQVFETTSSALLFFAEDLNNPDLKSKVKSKLRDGMIKFLRAMENEKY